jgi:hypothetical protein
MRPKKTRARMAERERVINKPTSKKANMATKTGVGILSIIVSRENIGWSSFFLNLLISQLDRIIIGTKRNPPRMFG